MTLTDALTPVRSHKLFRLAGCFIIPVLLAFAHLLQGADSAVASAWLGLWTCIAFGLVLLLRSAEEIPAATLLMFGLLATFVGLGWTGNWHQARAEIIQLATAILVFTCGAMLARSHQLLMTSLSVLAGSFALLATFALLSFPMEAANSNAATGSPAAEAAMRLSFTFRSPNTLASIMGLGSIVSAMHLAYLMRAKVPTGVPLLAKLSRIPRSGYSSILALFLCGSCLLLSLSRAGIILTAALLFIIAATEVYVRRSSETLDLGKRRFIFLGLIAGVALVVFAVLLTSGSIGERASDLDRAGHDRWALLSEYWKAWQAKPIFGHGLGSFNRINESITTMDTAATLVLLGAAHNVVLQWLLQVGLAGLGAMALVQLLIHARLLRNTFQARNRTRSYVSRMAVMASVFMLLHNMVDFPLEIPSVMWTYAFLLGLAYGMPDYAETRTGKPS